MGKSIAVLGMGRFGKKLALSLSEMGAEVMIVDASSEVLDKLSGYVTYAIEADLKDADALKGIGLENMDVVVVAMGSDLTASIMSVMAAKELGVPYVVTKAANDRMGAILEKVGADKIIYPEEETGFRTARTLMSDNFIEFFEIDSEVCILEIKPKKEWIGKSLIELNMREKYHASVVAVKDGDKMRSFIDPKKPLEENTQLLVVIDKKDLSKLK